MGGYYVSVLKWCITVETSCVSRFAVKFVHVICHVQLSQYEYYGIGITIVPWYKSRRLTDWNGVAMVY